MRIVFIRAGYQDAIRCHGHGTGADCRRGRVSSHTAMNRRRFGYGGSGRKARGGSPRS